MDAHGVLTARLAIELRMEYGEKGYDIFHDHRGDVKEDPEYVGKIVSWLLKGTNSRETELSQLDIAIVEKGSRHTIALIEIEETSGKPKTLLGDAMAALVGQEFQFKGQQLRTGAWTTLIIVARATEALYERNAYLKQLIGRARSGLRTDNNRIGMTVIEGFSSEADLWPKVRGQVEKARDYAASLAS